ncbi:hypothetical protein P154DRAFT_528265 [Amniculicola lignicola CBS 123094]|uniref:Uncharacterized protein n=1 Tax=Amniculicola lignicola CBS 123094 TaxID=1392246 RepID=A0A6A5W0J2_9PLEO|nr:hypothetical protein P154DRAFT_528265 [Amniculicola lignicola CBS 123094]
MCYHNYTQHSGCGHLGECHTQGWTLCAQAERRLADYRGPMSPPLSPPEYNMGPPPKRNSTSAAKFTKRMFSFPTNLARHASSTTQSSRRAVSGPSISRASTSSYVSTNDAGIRDHEWEVAKCKGDDVTRRTMVSSEMEVCKECMRWIKEMRFMIERYEKTGSVRGTGAFEEFLKWRADSVGGSVEST